MGTAFSQECSPQFRSAGRRNVFSVFAGRANGARTLVRRKIGWRRGLEISKRGSALPAFLRDKSRAPGEFSVGALNRYGRRPERASRPLHLFLKTPSQITITSKSKSKSKSKRIPLEIGLHKSRKSRKF